MTNANIPQGEDWIDALDLIVGETVLIIPIGGLVQGSGVQGALLHISTNDYGDPVAVTVQHDLDNTVATVPWTSIALITRPAKPKEVELGDVIASADALGLDVPDEVREFAANNGGDQ